MNNRELTTFILLGVFLVLLLIWRETRLSLGHVLKVMLSPMLALSLISFAGWTVLVVWTASRLGLWSWDLTASTVLWFLFVGLAWFIRLSEAGKDRDFFKRRVVETVGVGAVFEFFINLEVLSLPLELVLQVVILVVVLLDVFARQKEEFKPVAKVTTTLLAIGGLALTAFTVRSLIRDWSTLDLQEVVGQLLLPVWLTVAAVPFIYLVALYAGYESLFFHLKFWNESQRTSIRAIVGVVVALKGSLVDIAGFRGLPAKQAARTHSFREARRAVHIFKRERASEQVARIWAKQRLITYAGVPGADADGLQLDRREFAETKRALRWLATCHMGWYQREDRPDTYRGDLLSVLDDFSHQGLPGDHGIVMKVRQDGQAWFAHRATPSGYVFGIGAVGAPPSQWYYDGVKAPKSLPTRGAGWASSMEPDRPEWREEQAAD